MDYMSDAGASSSPTSPVLRSLKACRRCRRLKMKCDSREHVPCTRCRKAGTDCRVDPAGQKAFAPSAGLDSVDRQTILDLASQVQEFKNELELLRGQRREVFESRQPLADVARASALQRQTEDESRMAAREPEQPMQLTELTPEEMAAPLTAVDAMANSSKNTPSGIAANPRQAVRSQDLISKGIISEERARALFDMFLGGSRPFIPIFDPVMDTFDSMRSRSPYCFTVILYLALQRSPEARDDIHLLIQCQDEVKRLVADTLFTNPAKLESVQGMLLHAAYSEKTWFARGHALQMAVDLGLQHALRELCAPRMEMNDPSSITRNDRVLISKARTWILIYSMEQESASGTSRQPRASGADMPELLAFLDHPLSLPSDMRLVAIIELNNVRQRFRQTIEIGDPSECLARLQAPGAFDELRAWHDKWDQIHDQHGFDKNSFARSSMILLVNYNKIFLLCSVLGKLQKQRRITMASELDDPEIRDAISRLLNVMMKQLSQFLDTPAYKWQLKWAPSYSAIIIAFTAVFGLKIARLHPDLADTTSLLDKCKELAQILQKIPYTSFYRLLSLLIALPLNQPRTMNIAKDGTQNQQTAQDQNLNKFKSIWCEPGDNRDPQSSLPTFGQGLSEGSAGNLHTTSQPGSSGPQPLQDDTVLRTLLASPEQFAQGLQAGGTLQAPSWMLTDASIEGFAFPDEGEASFFDFDLMLSTDQQR